MTEHAAFCTDMAATMIAAFERCDAEFLAKYEEDTQSREFDSGTTALAICLRGTTLTVANLGDCRAVMCREDGSCLPLSVDQTPDLEEERIVAAGGWVKRNREMHIPKWKTVGACLLVCVCECVAAARKCSFPQVWLPAVHVAVCRRALGRLVDRIVLYLPDGP
mgnify:CR=1 FL=1